MLSLRSKRTLDSQKSVFNAFGRKTSLGAPAELCWRTAKYSSWVLDIKKKSCSLKLSKQWRIQEFLIGGGSGGVRPMIYSPLLAKQYFPRQRRSVCTDWKTRDRLYFLSWWTITATTRSITGSLYQPVKSSEIENEKLTLNRRSWSHGLSDDWWAVVRTCTHTHLHHDLDNDVDEICTIVVTKHKRRMFQRADDWIITCNRD